MNSRCRCRQNPIWLYADAARLEQVVTNLLTNAAKYSKEGGHVWLSAQQEGDKAVLRVRDAGLGIAPAFLPHVFELFTQAERLSDRSAGRVRYWIDPGEAAGGNARGNHWGFQHFGARQRVRRESCCVSARSEHRSHRAPPPSRNCPANRVSLADPSGGRQPGCGERLENAGGGGGAFGADDLHRPDRIGSGPRLSVPT